MTATPASTGDATYIYKEYEEASPKGNFPTWLQAVGTIGLLIFAWWQMRFVRRTTKATEDAAEATRDAVVATQKYVELTQELAAATKRTADFAQLAVTVERPYITVTPRRVQPQTNGARFDFVLQNAGTRPAIIREVRAQVKWSQSPDCPSGEERDKIARGRRIHEYVLAPGSSSRDYLLWYEDTPPQLVMTEMIEFLQEVSNQRTQANRELHLFGFISYNDPAGNRYGLEVCWSFLATRQEGIFYLDIFFDRPITEPQPITDP